MLKFGFFYDIIKRLIIIKSITYHIKTAHDNNFIIVSIFLYFMYNINKYLCMENIKNVWYIQIFNK